MPSSINWPEVVPYSEVYYATCCSHRQQPNDFKEALLALNEKLNARNTVQLLVGVEAGNADDIIDMAIRLETFNEVIAHGLTVVIVGHI